MQAGKFMRGEGILSHVPGSSITSSALSRGRVEASCSHLHSPSVEHRRSTWVYPGQCWLAPRLAEIHLPHCLTFSVSNERQWWWHRWFNYRLANMSPDHQELQYWLWFITSRYLTSLADDKERQLWQCRCCGFWCTWIPSFVCQERK